ncbi:MAG: hypothetical protein IE910_06025 [Brevundimonas sp.]|nr:hypothetical protein [Brevundimonas sp.]
MISPELLQLQQAQLEAAQVAAEAARLSAVASILQGLFAAVAVGVSVALALYSQRHERRAEEASIERAKAAEEKAEARAIAAEAAADRRIEMADRAEEERRASDLVRAHNQPIEAVLAAVDLLLEEIEEQAAPFREPEMSKATYVTHPHSSADALRAIASAKQRLLDPTALRDLKILEQALTRDRRISEQPAGVVRELERYTAEIRPLAEAIRNHIKPTRLQGSEGIKVQRLPQI